jgi:ParB family chromosome partitioning protein
MKPRNLRKPYQEIPISQIVPNPEQPRKIFPQAELEEMAASIREHGVIQAITVEECGDDFVLHDGEMRLRASKMAGLKVIPAVIHPPLNGTGPRERLERALVANVQRVEMHQVEEGLAYQRLITEFGYSVPQVSKMTGKASARIYHCLSLLKLEPEIQALLLQRRLPCGDGTAVTAMLSLPAGEERVKLLSALAERGATAQMVKRAVNMYLAGRSPRRSKKGSPAKRMVAEKLPEWDALYQLGKVPPWPMVNDAVMATCDSCPVRKQASDTTCRPCGLVAALKRMMEAVHEH